MQATVSWSNNKQTSKNDQSTDGFRTYQISRMTATKLPYRSPIQCFRAFYTNHFSMTFTLWLCRTNQCWICGYLWR